MLNISECVDAIVKSIANDLLCVILHTQYSSAFNESNGLLFGLTMSLLCIKSKVKMSAPKIKSISNIGFKYISVEC